MGVKLDEAVKLFEDLVSGSVDENGIYPAPGVILMVDGTVQMMSMALNAFDCFRNFVGNTLNKKDVSAGVFGLDCSTLPGQGTEFADVLVCVLYEAPAPDILEKEPHFYRLRSLFTFGVINYQHEPRIVRSMDFSNEYWNKSLRGELAKFVPPLIIEKKPRRFDRSKQWMTETSRALALLFVWITIF